MYFRFASIIYSRKDENNWYTEMGSHSVPSESNGIVFHAVKSSEITFSGCGASVITSRPKCIAIAHFKMPE